ncbi:MAG: ubiquinol-cytochrome c reductase cytochrome b subunit, partial [Oleispira sp.]
MSKQKSPIMGWIDDRLPVTVTYEKHLSKYY